MANFELLRLLTSKRMVLQISVRHGNLSCGMNMVEMQHLYSS